jgi:conjugal transfer mating pair stabilization protein TraG
MTFTIVTYGGGELLEILFNALAVLLNGKSGTLFKPLVRIGLLVGLMGATLSMVRGNHLGVLTRWMIPFYLALTLFLAPVCTVIIKDPALRQPPFRVEHVPWGLGAVAGTLSQLGDLLTRQLERVFALPDGLKYHQTGAMMASNLIAQSKQFHVTNTELAETLREFVNQCVVYEALLGKKYTLQELKESQDLWGLVTQNPSPARSFVFKHPGLKAETEICTCKEGVQKLKPLLEGHIETSFGTFWRKLFGHPEGQNQGGKTLLNPSTELKKYLPLAFGYMAKMSQDAAALMRQQMMIYAVVEATEHKSESLGNAPNFAVRRAYLQQRAQEETLAGIAANKLIAIKNVLEALIYASFLFVVPLALTPLGWKFLGRWAGLVLWIQLWAPLYAVLNFIMNVSARSRGMGIISLPDGTSGGITLANSVGFMNLHADMAAYAGYLSLAVGSIAYGIIQGGASGLAHLSNPLQGPAVSAASRATEDLMSGNYSFGNLSEGTVQAYNTTFGQEQGSPSYSSGAFTQQDGQVTRVTAMEGGHSVTLAQSNLRSSVNWSESLSEAYTEQAARATQAASNQLHAAGESEGEALRQFADFSQHQAKQGGTSETSATSRSASETRSISTLESLVEKFAKDSQVSTDTAWRAFGSVMGGKGFLEFFNVSAGLEISRTQVSREVMSAAKEYSKQHGFQQAWQESKQALQESRTTVSDDQGQRFVESLQASVDQASQLRNEASVNLQRAESFTKTAAMTRQQGTSLSVNLNQEYVGWLAQQPLPHSSGPMGQREAEHILLGRPELDVMYQRRFLETKMNSFSADAYGLPASEAAVEAGYEAQVDQLQAPQRPAPLQDSRGSFFGEQVVPGYPPGGSLGGLREAFETPPNTAAAVAEQLSNFSQTLQDVQETLTKEADRRRQDVKHHTE